MLPFLLLIELYVVTGVLYGPFILVKRFLSYRAFKKLPTEETTALNRESPAYRGRRGQQTASLIFSGITFFSILIITILQFGRLELLSSGWFVLFGLVWLPPVVFFTNRASIWNKEQLKLENAALKEKVGRVRFYYVVMVANWIAAIAMSVYIAIIGV